MGVVASALLKLRVERSPVSMRFMLLQREFRVSNPQNDRGRFYHWCFMPIGDDSTGDFRAPLRCARNDREGEYHCVSYRQETIREGFPMGMKHSDIS